MAVTTIGLEPAISEPHAPDVAPPVLVDVAARRRHRHPVAIRLPRSLARLTGPVLLVLAWQGAVTFGVVDADTLPAPVDVVTAARDLIASGELQQHLWTSLGRVVQGLVAGIVIGVVLALAAGLSRIGDNLIDANMEILRAVPNFALLPLLIIWFGIDEQTKVILIALSVVVAIYINTYSAIRSVDANLVEAATVFGLRRWGLVRHVILPAAVPGFLVGLRLALTGAWLALIFAETVNARQGIGRLMTDAREYFQLDVIFVVLAIYALLGLASVTLVRLLENHLLRWRRSFEGS